MYAGLSAQTPSTRGIMVPRQNQSWWYVVPTPAIKADQGTCLPFASLLRGLDKDVYGQVHNRYLV